jgi:hypothetical protein
MKAYILKTDNKISTEYAEVCAKSCAAVGLDWEYVEWWSEGCPKEAWQSIDIPIRNFNNFRAGNAKAQFATSGHANIWKKIRDSGEPGVVLEHDAIMLHGINIEIPDGVIVTLGYKLEKPEEYNHVKAGPPQKVIEVTAGGHEGAHAYVITHNTAAQLLKELEDHGIKGAIDNTHFLKSRSKHTKIPLHIMDPTPALGWLRESTIWKVSATRNYEFIQSFANNYKK